MNPMKVLNDSFNMYSWNNTQGNDQCKDWLIEIESQILFNGNRIRKNGTEAEQAWFEAFLKLMTLIKDFITERAENICLWRGKQDGAGAAAFYQQLCGATGSASTPTPVAAAAPEEKKVAPVKAALPKAAPVKKAPAAPIKERRGPKWCIENYDGGETIRFDDDEDINKRVSFDLFNCKNITIELVGKCQRIKAMNCKNVTIICDYVVADVTLFKCQANVLRAKKSVPMVTIEGCSQINIYLNNATLQTKVSTSCTRATIVHFPAAGITDEQLETENEIEHWVMKAVPEVYTTSINAD